MSYVSGGLGELCAERVINKPRIRKSRRSKRPIHTMAKQLQMAFEAGRRMAKRGRSPHECNYSDPARVTAWLRGFYSAKEK